MRPWVSGGRSFGESTVTELRVEEAARSTGLTKVLSHGHGEPWKVLELGSELEGCADAV